MKTFLYKFIDLVFYGNFYIALCAVAMTMQTEYLLFNNLEWTTLNSFVFFATLFLYAMHRIIGIGKVKAFLEKYRYAIIYKFRNHIKLYALIGVIGAFYCFFYLSFSNQILLVIPAFLSLGYVLPFIKGQRRLRDLDYLKIFLIAIVWAVITVLMPIMERTSLPSTSQFITLSERALFIFAITLPFDIRDLKVDAHIDVKTIPAMIGIYNTKLLAAFLLLLAFLLAILNWHLSIYSFNTLLALFVSYVFSFYCIYNSDKTKGDYFFTGLMDGTMIIQFVLVLLFNT